MLQIASSLLCCGKKVWLETNETNIKYKLYRKIQKLIKDWLITYSPGSIFPGPILENPFGSLETWAQGQG